MKELLEKIVAFLPNYLLDFGQLLSGPKTFIASKLQSSDEQFVPALIFAAITCVLFFVVFSQFMGGGDLWAKLATFFIWSCIGICLTALSVIVAWRVVGWKAPPRETFVVVIYYNAAMSVIVAIFTLVAFGMWKVFIPEVYAIVVDTIRTGEFDYREKLEDLVRGWSGSIYALLIPVILGQFLLIFGYILQYIWFALGWGAFRQMNGFARWHSGLAFVITLLLNLPATAVVFFITVATMGKLE